MRQAPRRLTQALQEKYRTNVIRPSSFPWCSSVVLVLKKDGSFRFYVDFSEVNEITVMDSYSLPRIDSVLDTSASDTLFSALDLQSGYWQGEATA